MFKKLVVTVGTLLLWSSVMPSPPAEASYPCGNLEKWAQTYPKLQHGWVWIEWSWAIHQDDLPPLGMDTLDSYWPSAGTCDLNMQDGSMSGLGQLREPYGRTALDCWYQDKWTPNYEFSASGQVDGVPVSNGECFVYVQYPPYTDPDCTVSGWFVFPLDEIQLSAFTSSENWGAGDFSSGTNPEPKEASSSQFASGLRLVGWGSMRVIDGLGVCGYQQQ